MRPQMIFKRVAMAVLASSTLAGCGSGGASYSLLPEENAFGQTIQTVKGKLDILWIIDNSGSMQTSQDELAREFPAWFPAFDANDYDYRVAIGATDAWRTIFSPGTNYSKLRDGGSTHSGVFVIDPYTLNKASVFSTNAKLGINGSGDERSFQSFKAVLDDSRNSAFRRSDAKLNIIIVSDEDDTSHNGTGALGYTDPALHPISTYTAYLDAKTNSTATQKNYVVHSLTVKDVSCSNQQGGRPVGQRIMNLAAATGGISLRICDSFATTMANLSANFEVALQEVFYLERTPIPESIIVKLNGNQVPNSGWVYTSSDNSVRMLDPYKPQQGDTLSILYDPASVR